MENITMLLRICLVTLALLGITTVARAAAAIAEVRTLAELQAQKRLTARDTWEIQCGWSESGENGGPWLLMHLYAKYVGRDELPTKPRNLKTTGGTLLGPVTLHCQFEAEKQAPEMGEIGLPALPAENLFTASVLTARKGQYTLELRDGATVLASTVVDIKQPRVNYWHRFADLGRRGDATIYQATAKAYSVTPVFAGSSPLLKNKAVKLLEPPKDDRRVMLPLAIPSIPDAWMQSWADSVWKFDEPGRGLTLKLEKGDFEIEAVGKMIDWPDWHLAARWWVNGKPVVPPFGEVMARMEGRAVGATATMRVQFGYPESLGAKAGDEISLQLVYLPEEFEPLPKDGVGPAMLHAMGPDDGTMRVSMLSDVLTFKLTPELIQLTHKNQTEAAKQDR